MGMGEGEKEGAARLRLLLLLGDGDGGHHVGLELGRLAVARAALVLERLDLAVERRRRLAPRRRVLLDLAPQLGDARRAVLALGVRALRRDDHPRDVGGGALELRLPELHPLHVVEPLEPPLLDLAAQPLVVPDVVVEPPLVAVHLLAQRRLLPEHPPPDRRRHLAAHLLRLRPAVQRPQVDALVARAHLLREQRDLALLRRDRRAQIGELGLLPRERVLLLREVVREAFDLGLLRLVLEDAVLDGEGHVANSAGCRSDGETQELHGESW